MQDIYCGQIIDFHTHPMMKPEQCILMYKDSYEFTVENFKENLLQMGIGKICGSVINPNEKERDIWEKVKENNDTAYQLQELYGDFYYPGIHIHPNYVNESCEEILKAKKRGICLLGELVPYVDGWDYGQKGIHEILDFAEEQEMVVSVHSGDSTDMDTWMEEHPHLTIVGAHPGDWTTFFQQVERLKKYDNYMLDISANGITRFGMIRKLVNEAGSERILFGSDYPSCDPNVFLSGIINNPFITEHDKENILFRNARRLLNL